MQNGKIGVGIITCDRLEFFVKASNSLVNASKKYPNIEIVIVNDGTSALETPDINCINTLGRIGVGKAKNLALKELMSKNCEHIFLMEDDILIKNGEVFQKYIDTALNTGVKHLNFGLHGNHNLDLNKKPIVRKTINYTDGCKIDLYPNLLGAFSYYHIDVLDKCGLIDEEYYNALEHVDHTYQIIKEGYHPPFRWFADIHNSQNYLEDIVEDHKESKIRSDEDFHKKFITALDIFIKKNNFSVIGNYGPQEKNYTIQEVIQNLITIHEKHARK